MKKEIIICCVVIILVVVLNIITSKHTDNVMDEITENLNLLREKIITRDVQNADKDIEEISNKWSENNTCLAYYIEHDELEKVELYLCEARSNIETKEYNMAIQSLDSCKFIIAHIKEKYKFKIENIF